MKTYKTHTRTILDEIKRRFPIYYKGYTQQRRRTMVRAILSSFAVR